MPPDLTDLPYDLPKPSERPRGARFMPKPRPDDDLLREVFLIYLESIVKGPDGEIAGKLARGEPLEPDEKGHICAECWKPEFGLNPKQLAALERLSKEPADAKPI